MVVGSVTLEGWVVSVVICVTVVGSTGTVGVTGWVSVCVTVGTVSGASVTHAVTVSAVVVGVVVVS